MNLFNESSNRLKDTFNLNGYIDTESAEKSIRGNINFSGPNAWILAVAIIIASVGLNVNSIPVIIGAMLISPLMGPIFGIGLGLGVNDIELMKQSGKNLLVMVLISLAVSFLYFLLTPLSLSNPTELLARTSPTFYDVLIALFGGLAGILEQCRKEKGTVFSGVAIATALMPPLCTAGFALASGNFSFFIGAIYLFIINCTFIMLSTYFAVKYFKFRQIEYQDKQTGNKSKRITSFLIILFIIPSIWSAVSLIKQNNFEVNAIAFAEHSNAYGNSIIYDYKIEHKDKSVIRLYFTGEALTEASKNNIYQVADRYGIKHEQILISEYTTDANADQAALVNDLYKRMDSEILKRDNDIKRLKEQLSSSRKKEIPYLQLSREISSNYPLIREIQIASGAKVRLDSTYTIENSMIVVCKSDTILPPEEASRLEEWLKVRLDTEVINLIQVSE